MYEPWSTVPTKNNGLESSLFDRHVQPSSFHRTTVCIVTSMRACDNHADIKMILMFKYLSLTGKCTEHLSPHAANKKNRWNTEGFVQDTMNSISFPSRTIHSPRMLRASKVQYFIGGVSRLMHHAVSVTCTMQGNKIQLFFNSANKTRNSINWSLVLRKDCTKEEWWLSAKMSHRTFLQIHRSNKVYVGIVYTLAPLCGSSMGKCSASKYPCSENPPQNSCAISVA